MEIPYTLIRSNRKSIAIHITTEGTVEVRCPRRCSRTDVEAFVLSKQDWIARHLERISRQPVLPKFSEPEIRFLAEQAAASLPERVREQGRAWRRQAWQLLWAWRQPVCWCHRL